MNNRESKRMMGTFNTSEKMKRIVLVFLCTMTIMSCGNDPVVEERIDNPPPGTGKEVTLNVIIPKNSASTYANEDANTEENFIDSLYIYLYQGATLLSDIGFKRPLISNADFTIQDDSTLIVKYEVDNISGPTGLRVEVFANRRAPEELTGEIPLPIKTQATNFFMSGKDVLGTNPQGTGYAGTVKLQRNVAKLRVKISKNSVFIPDDLGIDYPNVKVQVTTTPKNTTPFYDDTRQDFANMSYPARPLRPINNNINTFAGGQIDSVYLYENRRTSYGAGDADATQVTITIPTFSSEGNKTVTKTYKIQTPTTGLDVLRNYIYTLDIKVQGQGLDPLVTLELERWNDVNIDGSIGSTYLTTDVSEILFDAAGKATINFCTDAQAIYFDFATFNNNNSGVATLGVGNTFDVEAIGVDVTDTILSPAGFRGGQLLLDQKHCGSFSFQLDLSKFPQFPNINFSGSICIKAGNIVKCFTFPAKQLYDAHFIVGEPLLNGELFTSASTTGGSWIEVSTNRMYTSDAGTTVTITSGIPAPFYLHLDENILSGLDRAGSITLRNGSVEKTVHITQLRALPVGPFGQTDPGDDPNKFNTGLFTEQMPEYTTLVQYSNASGANAALNIYNGFSLAQNASILNTTNYNNGTFSYQNTLYSAINYCMYKNRHSPKTASGALAPADIKWYLPAQAQLMGMWLSYESYKSISPRNNNGRAFFDGTSSQAYWSSTGNSDYTDEAQYLNFAYGNVGHVKKNIADNKRYWTRCVRNGGTSTSMVSGTTINFNNGMPATSHSNTTKIITSLSQVSNENEANNQTLYSNLRVAIQDATPNPVKWSFDICNTYNAEPGVWRLPTQRELQAIWILQNELNGNASFNLLKDDYYWSVTRASEAATNYWVVFGSINHPGGSGNTPHRYGSELSRVRCVQQQ